MKNLVALRTTSFAETQLHTGSEVREIMYNCPHTQEENEIISDQSLRHKVPVRPIEELFLHMIVQARMRWMWRVLVVEDELGRFVLSRL